MFFLNVQLSESDQSSQNARSVGGAIRGTEKTSSTHTQTHMRPTSIFGP